MTACHPLKLCELQFLLDAGNDCTQWTEGNTLLTAFAQFRLDQHFREAPVANAILDTRERATCLA